MALLVPLWPQDEISLGGVAFTRINPGEIDDSKVDATIAEAAEYGVTLQVVTEPVVDPTVVVDSPEGPAQDAGLDTDVPAYTPVIGSQPEPAESAPSSAGDTSSTDGGETVTSA